MHNNKVPIFLEDPNKVNKPISPQSTSETDSYMDLHKKYISKSFNIEQIHLSLLLYTLQERCPWFTRILRYTHNYSDAKIWRAS
jgi:hypothetical protein